jgi:hypothetical protein
MTACLEEGSELECPENASVCQIEVRKRNGRLEDVSRLSFCDLQLLTVLFRSAWAANRATLAWTTRFKTSSVNGTSTSVSRSLGGEKDLQSADNAALGQHAPSKCLTPRMRKPKPPGERTFLSKK